MSLITKLTALWTLALIILAGMASAEVPQMINYQGRLTDGTGAPVADGAYQINFKIYGSTAGDDSLWWSEFQTVQVTDGLFDYELGSMAPLPNDLFFLDTTRYLGITVGSDPELAPRVKLISVPYAYQALRADTAYFAPSGGGWIDAGAVVSLVDNTDKVLIGTSTSSINKMDVTSPTLVEDMAIINAEAIGPSDLNVTAIRGVSEAGEYGRGGYFRGGIGGAFGIAEGTGTGNYFGFSGRAWGGSGTNTGIKGNAFDGPINYAVYGIATGSGTLYGVYGSCGFTNGNYGGYFYGNLHSTGSNTKGGGGIKIDHPLDPENQYLFHCDVGSPEMKNVYDGVVRLDAGGEATVDLPDYFEALNSDFRYQLTCIGGFAPVYISEKISGNRFVIAGGEPLMEVSWQVTGIRKDAYAEANRTQVEIDKPENEKGLYMHPTAFGLSEEKQIHYEQNKKAQENPEGYEE